MKFDQETKKEGFKRIESGDREILLYFREVFRNRRHNHVYPISYVNIPYRDLECWVIQKYYGNGEAHFAQFTSNLVRYTRQRAITGVDRQLYEFHRGYKIELIGKSDFLGDLTKVQLKLFLKRGW